MEALFQKLVSVNIDILWVTLFAIYFSVEQIVNSASLLKNRTIHMLHAIPLQIGYMLINFGLAFVVVACVQWIGKNQFGLFNQVQVPYPFKVIFGVLCIDFVAYWFHRSYHTFSILWCFHRVHHSDTTMDSSTFLRFHPFDWFLDNSSSIVACFIFGLDLNILTFNFILYLPLFLAHHGTYVFPAWFDNSFGKIIVSPNFHKVHHHQNQEFTDTNYGNIFIIWDKLFGTYKTLPVKEIKYGLAEFDSDERQSFWFLLKSPFINIKRPN